MFRTSQPIYSKKIVVLTLIALLSCGSKSVWGQDKTTKLTTQQDFPVLFGIQFKPLINNTLATISMPFVTKNNVSFEIQRQGGYALGMTIRKDLSKRWSIESGLGLMNRDYNVAMRRTDTPALSREATIRVLAYDLPVSGLLYIRLGERLYTNVALGTMLTFFPSDLAQQQDNYTNLFVRNRRIMLGGIANIGLEYRTEKKGYFYLGASYQLPFANTYTSRLAYIYPNQTRLETDLKVYGDYLTIDLRYFFNNPPKEKEKSYWIED